MNPDLPQLWADYWPILAGLVIGSLMGALAMAPFAARGSQRHYNRGCRDTENRLVKGTRDRRHDTTSARLPRF